MRRAIEALTPFFRSVPDHALPQLREHQRHMVRRLCAILFIAAPFVLSADVASGIFLLKPTLIFVGVWLCVWLGVAASTRLEHFHNRPHRSLMVAGLALTLLISCTPWLSPTGTSEHVRLMVVVPLLIAALSFWKPHNTLLLGAIAVPASLLNDVLGGGDLSSWVSRVGVGIVLTVVGMTSNSVVRRIWLQWEESRKQLMAADRMGQLGRMTAGVAHELKTPIAAVDHAVATLRTLVDELAESIGDERVTADDLRQIASELEESIATAKRGNSRVAGFVDAIRGQTRGLVRKQLEPVRIAQRLDALRTLFRHNLKKTGVSLIDEVDPNACVFGDPGKIDQLLTNLIGNALDAITDAGRGARITVRARTADSSGGVVLEVVDDGPGIRPSVRERIFDYLFTTRAAENGTGLGLAICRDIAEGSFRGSLTLEHTPEGGGAHFVAVLRDAERAKEQQVFVPSQHFSKKEPPAVRSVAG